MDVRFCQCKLTRGRGSAGSVLEPGLLSTADASDSHSGSSGDATVKRKRGRHPKNHPISIGQRGRYSIVQDADGTSLVTHHEGQDTKFGIINIPPKSSQDDWSQWKPGRLNRARVLEAPSLRKADPLSIKLMGSAPSACNSCYSKSRKCSFEVTGCRYYEPRTKKVYICHDCVFPAVTTDQGVIMGTGADLPELRKRSRAPVRTSGSNFSPMPGPAGPSQLSQSGSQGSVSSGEQSDWSTHQATSEE